LVEPKALFHLKIAYFRQLMAAQVSQCKLPVLLAFPDRRLQRLRRLLRPWLSLRLLQRRHRLSRLLQHRCLLSRLLQRRHRLHLQVSMVVVVEASAAVEAMATMPLEAPVEAAVVEAAVQVHVVAQVRVTEMVAACLAVVAA